MRTAAERRRIVAMAEQFRIGRIAQVVNRVAAIAPGGEADSARADEVMQRGALAERSGLFLAAGAVQHLAQDREEGEDLLLDAAVGPGEGRKAGAQILQHAQPGKDLASLRAKEVNQQLGVSEDTAARDLEWLRRKAFSAQRSKARNPKQNRAT